jgi:hypothetical protein
MPVATASKQTANPTAETDPHGMGSFFRDGPYNDVDFVVVVECIPAVLLAAAKGYPQ